jgi:hypothetical protein
MGDSTRSGATPTDGSDAVRRVADALARRGLTVPAIVLLEMLRPMGFLCGQLLWVLDPALSPVTGAAHRRLAHFFEDSGNIDRLLSALEER